MTITDNDACNCYIKHINGHVISNGSIWHYWYSYANLKKFVSVDFLERDDIKRGFPFYSVVLGASGNEGVGFDKYELLIWGVFPAGVVEQLKLLNDWDHFEHCFSLLGNAVQDRGQASLNELITNVYALQVDNWAIWRYLNT